MSCIFCGGVVENVREAHVVPAAMGGGSWAVLPPGIECDRCNEYLGTKVEKAALESWPFKLMKVLLSIRNRDGKFGRIESPLGPIYAEGEPGTIHCDFPLERAPSLPPTIRMTFVAEPSDRVAVCRMLLKMGLETMARYDVDRSRLGRFDAVRQFVRYPKKGSSWWFAIHDETPELPKLLSDPESAARCAQMTVAVEEHLGVEIVVAELGTTWFFSPLESHAVPGSWSEIDPSLRLFWATV